MPWKKSPSELVALFERVRPPEEAGVRHRQMFGYPCCFVNDNLFMGLHQDNLMLRLSESDRIAFLRLPGAREFEPMPGRPMREYVTMPHAMLNDVAELRSWIQRSLTYASSLQPKAKRPRSRK
jgi:TfoX/Sxy family transcriptional regulator of competence genes